MSLPILDTEEKLRAYLNKIAGCEVDPLTIKAYISPDCVHLDENPDPGIHIEFAQSSPRWFQVLSYGMVDRAVLPVLKELHARHDREIQEAAQKRREESYERAVANAARRVQYHQQAPVQPEPPSLLTRIRNLFK